MEQILNSDKHFLLSNWINDAVLKAKNLDERDLYEWNARAQISLWGLNSTSEVYLEEKCKFKNAEIYI